MQNYYKNIIKMISVYKSFHDEAFYNLQLKKLLAEVDNINI